MLDFFAKAKEIELSSGRRINVLRPGLAFYFMLTDAILELKTVEIKQTDNIKDYLDWLKDNTEEVAKYTIYWRNVKRILEHFVSVAVDDLTEKETAEALQEAQAFNTYKTNGNGKAIQSVMQLNEALNNLIAFIAANTHYNIEYIGRELNIIQASILAEHFNSLRVTQINDMIAAISGAVGGKEAQKGLSKYLAELRGKKSGTFEEAIKAMVEAEDIKNAMKGGNNGK